MARFDLVVKGGAVATATDTFRADIGVKDGRIAALADNLEDAAEVVDASGRLVLPGGIDSHCHMDQPPGLDGARNADDFLSATQSAVTGGTTTVIPFAQQLRGQSLRAAVEDYHRKAEGKPVIDYAFHLIVTDPTPSVLGQELPALIGDGYTSFKLYMTYDSLKVNDRQILDILALARREGAMTMIHAENTDCIEWLTEKLELAGRVQPRYHATSRPNVVEREATHRAISLAELLDTPILLVHVSAKEAIEQIHWAQGRGLKIYGETCPQYLFLSEEDMGGFDDDDWHGARCMCSPPPRDKANQEFVWRGLEQGIFSVLSSDHSPFTLNKQGKFAQGPKPPFSKIGNGVPGIATRLPLLFSEGVQTGRLSLQQFVALTATNHAKLYGLHPKKGTIAIGADADLAIWDKDREVTITWKMLNDRTGYTPYEGRRVKGWPVEVFSRGERVMREGEVTAKPGRGQFMRCALPETAVPRGRPVVDPALFA
ncbi:dihydropyrimidinase [Desertibaculum subflavum]|uniref:dihydropyrimidinase n=1 Tax=Desertibaculum subflavum TaxID=2268458 RepID=UPI000E67245C